MFIMSFLLLVIAFASFAFGYVIRCAHEMDISMHERNKAIHRRFDARYLKQ